MAVRSAFDNFDRLIGRDLAGDPQPRYSPQTAWVNE